MASQRRGVVTVALRSYGLEKKSKFFGHRRGLKMVVPKCKDLEKNS